MKLKIAVSAQADFRPYGELMKSKGYDITYIDSIEKTEEETIRNLQGFNTVIAFGEPFTEKVFAALAPTLKLVCRFGLGYDLVDIHAAARHGVCVTNTAGMMAGGVAETALLLMLECGRRFAKFDAEMQAGQWTRGYIGSQLEGKTVGLIGFGSIARRLARYLIGFHCRVLSYDVAYDEKALRDLNVSKATLDEIAAQSDYVSIHCPLNPATRHIVDAQFLGKMKPSAYVVNTSRGPTLDQDALIDALDRDVVAGAGLDVYDGEPLSPTSALRGRHNVTLTPHIASLTFESSFECAEDIMSTFESFQGGAIPDHCLNRDYTKF